MKECPRCLRERKIYARGFCVGCYNVVMNFNKYKTIRVPKNKKTRQRRNHEQ